MNLFQTVICLFLILEDVLAFSSVSQNLCKYYACFMKNLYQFSVYDIQYLLFSYPIFATLRCSQLWLNFELIVNFKINTILKFLMPFCIS